MKVKTRIIAFETINLSPKEWKMVKSNPNYWKMDGVRKNFDYVYAPSYPEIEKAYNQKGIVSFREGMSGKPEKIIEIELPIKGNIHDLEDGLFDDLREQVVEVEQVETVEPVVATSSLEDEPELIELTEQPKGNLINWRELSWPKMRALAFTIRPDLPKNQNKEQIIAELEKCEQEGLL